MSDTATPVNAQPLADLVTLHQQLQEWAAKAKRPRSNERDQRPRAEGPVPAIRGK